MKKRFSGRKKFNRILVPILCMSLIAPSILGGCGKDDDMTAITMRLQRLVGVVNLFNEQGKELTLTELMKLISGQQLTTSDESLVSVSLDETKIITMEANSKAEIITEGKNLRFVLKEGNIFFNVVEKLDADATFQIETANMICGIRGTSGEDGYDKNGNPQVKATDGELSLTLLDEDNNVIGDALVTPGNKAVIENGGSGDSDGSNIVVKPYTPEELSPTALDTINKSDALLERVSEATGFDKEKIIALGILYTVPGKSMVGEAADALAGEGKEDSIPYQGQAAEEIVGAATEAYDIAGEDLDLEVEIITGLKGVMDTGIGAGAQDEELTELMTSSKDGMRKVCEPLLKAGLDKEDTLEAVKLVSAVMKETTKKMADQNLSTADMAKIIGTATDILSSTIEKAATAGGDTDVLSALTAQKEEISKTVTTGLQGNATGNSLSDSLENLSATNGDSSSTTGAAASASSSAAGLGQTGNTGAGQNAGRAAGANAAASTTSVQTPTTNGTVQYGVVNNASSGTSDSATAGSGSGSGTTGGEASGGSESGGSESGGSSEASSSGSSEEPAPGTYTVTLDTDGGTINSGNVTSYKAGEEVALPTDVTKAQTAGYIYSFEGWYTAKSGGEKVEKISSSDTGDKTFYAVWKETPKTYGVEVTTGSGGQSASAKVGDDVVTSAAVDSTVTLTATADTYYQFDHWIDSRGNTGINSSTSNPVSFKMPAGAVSVTASFVRKSYSVNLDAQGGTINSGNVTSYNEGEETILPTDVTKEQTAGYTYSFEGWYTATSGGEKVEKISASDTGDKTFYAVWKETPKVYGVEVTAGSGGQSASAKVGDEVVTSAAVDSTVTLTATADSYHDFEHWVDSRGNTGINSSTSNPVSFKMPAGAVSVSAAFAPKSYSVNLDTQGGTINSGSISSYSYGTGATLPTDVTKTEDNDYVYGYDGWYTDSTGGSKVTAIGATESGDKTYYAHWNTTQKYGINVTAEPDVSAETSVTVSGSYPCRAVPGENITVSVTPKTGYDFVSWEDLGHNTGISDLTATTLNFAMPSADVELKALLDPQHYTVTLLDGMGGEITIHDGISDYYYGTGATLPTEVSKESTDTAVYEFDGWYTEQSGGSKVTSISTTDTGDKTFYAHWNTKYFVSYSSDSGIASIEGPDGDIAAPGDSVTVDITRNSGYWLSSFVASGVSAVAKLISDFIYRVTFTMPENAVSLSIGTSPSALNVGVTNPSEGGVAKVDGSSEGSTAAADSTVYGGFEIAEGYELDSYTVERLDVSGAFSVDDNYRSVETTESQDGFSFTMPGAPVMVTPSFRRGTYTITPGFVGTFTENYNVQVASSAVYGDEVAFSVTDKSTGDAVSNLTLSYTYYKGQEYMTGDIRYDAGLGKYKFTMPPGNATITNMN